MKRILRSPYFWLVLAILILGSALSLSLRDNAKRRAEIERLEGNQTTLLGEVEHYRAENGRMAASVQALTLKRDEFATLLEAEKKKVERLGIKIKELESLGEITTDTDVDMEAEIIAPDTIYIDTPVMGTFEWSDGWVSIAGELTPESIRAHINITDTITIVAHRKARKWLFFRCKGKITHYDALSANPHTIIANIRYFELTE